MSSHLKLEDIKKKYHGSLKAYLIGFMLSLVLTCASFGLVAAHALESSQLIFAIIGLALLQAFIQFLYFFHIGKEAKPRWESFAFYCMLVILFIIVAGSLWVMHDLNSRMMPQMTMTKEKLHD